MLTILTKLWCNWFLNACIMFLTLYVRQFMHCTNFGNIFSWQGSSVLKSLIPCIMLDPLCLVLSETKQNWHDLLAFKWSEGLTLFSFLLDNNCYIAFFYFLGCKNWTSSGRINFVSGFDEGMYFWEVTQIQKLSSIQIGF